MFLTVRVAFVWHIGNSDNSSLSAVISMAQAVRNLCVTRKVFLNNQVNWKTVCGAIQDHPGVTFGMLTILLRSWTSICCCWLDAMFQPRSFVCATRISLGLMVNAGMILTSSRRRIFGGTVIALGLTVKSLSGVKWVPMKPIRRLNVSLVSKTGML